MVPKDAISRSLLIFVLILMWPLLATFSTATFATSVLATTGYVVDATDPYDSRDSRCSLKQHINSVGCYP